MLTVTATFALWGRLTEPYLFGRKNGMLFATAVFMIASIICAVAPNMATLIVGRALQGVGGAGIQALSLTVVSEIVAEAERPKWQGLLGAVFGLSSVIGPFLGGSLSDVNWRIIFWINGEWEVRD